MPTVVSLCSAMASSIQFDIQFYTILYSDLFIFS